MNKFTWLSNFFHFQILFLVILFKEINVIKSYNVLNSCLETIFGLPPPRGGGPLPPPVGGGPPPPPPPPVPPKPKLFR